MQKIDSFCNHQVLRFCYCQGQDFSFWHLIRTSLPSHLSFGNWLLFFQKESGWSIMLATTSRTEVMNAWSSAYVYLWTVYCVRFSFAVFPSFLRAKEARWEGIWTGIWNVIWMFAKLEGVMWCINLQSQDGYLWRLLVKFELLAVSVSAPRTCVGVNSVTVFCSNKQVHCLSFVYILLFSLISFCKAWV